MLKSLHPTFYAALATLFNRVRATGTPSMWNHLKLISLHKKGSLQDPDNYRGLSIMTILPKLYATIMADHMATLAEER